jgi:hypothetical protein
MGSDDDSALIRRESAAAQAGRGGALALRVLAVVVLGTIGFYLSVAVAYVLADADMSAPETYQMMFPRNEVIILAIVAVTSALTYLVVAKGGLYRAIVDAGFAGWIALCPCAIALLTVVRGVVVDLAYYPIHYNESWTPAAYAILASDPLTGSAAYIIDGAWLFAASMLLAKGIAVGDREADVRPY